MPSSRRCLASSRAPQSLAGARDPYNPDMTSFRILILGGYGLFGGRIVAALANDPALILIVAGRSPERAAEFVSGLRETQASIEVATLDTTFATFNMRLAELRPDLVIDTAGPFQSRDYRVAEAALAIGAHCIDLADSRAYVSGIGALDAAARTANRRVVSGASSVPGLNAAVVASLHSRFAKLESVESAISPGNRTARGWATMLAILGCVGKPYPVLHDGRHEVAYGWQSLRRIRIANVGTRWLANCEVPDLDVLPARYPELKTVEFRAGLELWRMHFGLWLGSLAVRFGPVRSLLPFARPLFVLSERWQGFGSDVGVMQVVLRGRDHEDKPLALTWTLIARDGDGPQIPATAAVLLARKLARGELAGGGASACIDLFTLDEFMQELAGYVIQASLEEQSDLPQQAH